MWISWFEHGFCGFKQLRVTNPHARILYYLWLSIPESTKMSTGVWGIKGSWLPQWYDLRYVNIVLSLIVNCREYRDVYWCLRKHDMSWDMLILYYLWLSIPESTEMSTGVWGIKGSWLPQWYDLRYVNIVLSMIVNSREYKDVYWCLRNQRQLVTSMIWLEIC